MKLIPNTDLHNLPGYKQIADEDLHNAPLGHEPAGRPAPKTKAKPKEKAKPALFEPFMSPSGNTHQFGQRVKVGGFTGTVIGQHPDSKKPVVHWDE